MKYASSLCIALCLLFNSNLFSQSTCINIDADPFGDAEITSGFEYIITKKQTNQIGGFWGNSSISLDDDFDFSFRIYLGDNDGGADGVAFLLRGVGSQGQGSSGGGVGYQGISPSFAVEFDTYANGSNGDPSQDHTAIQLNGNPNHNNSSANIFGPVNIGTGGNVEDDAHHEVRFVWEAATNTFTYYFDGVELTQMTRDLEAHFGTNEVIWGFTGSTGGFFNEQKICALTAINSNLDKDKDGILDSIECNGSINCQNTDAPADTFPNNEDLDADGDGCFDAFEAGVSNSNTPHPDDVTDINNLTIDNLNGLITSSAIINANGGYHANASDLPDDNGNGIPNILEPVDLSFSQEVSDQSIQQTLNGSFTFDAPNGNLNIVWEVSTDNGNSWTVLTDTPPYSGTTTNTLTITNASASMNNNRYKAIIQDQKYTCAGINDSEGILTVLPPPDLDLDNDGVLDSIECRGITPCPNDDPENDNLPNNQDLDSDGDGCFDAVEAGYPSTNGYPDSLTNIQENVDGLITNSPTINANSTVANPSGYHTNNQFLNLNGNTTLDIFEKVDLNFTTALPAITTIEYNNDVSLQINSSNTNITVLWQTSTDNINWTDVPNTAPYSGINTNTLVIAGVTDSFQDHYFRAVIEDVNYSCGGTANTQTQLNILPPPDLDIDKDGILDVLECESSSGAFSNSNNTNGNLTLPNSNGTANWEITNTGQDRIVSTGVSDNGGLYFVYDGNGSNDWNLTSTFTLSNIPSNADVQLRLYANVEAPSSDNSFHHDFNSKFNRYTISWTGGTSNATIVDNDNEIVGGTQTIANGGSFEQANGSNSNGSHDNDSLSWYVDFPKGATSFTIMAENGSALEGFRFTAIENFCPNLDADQDNDANNRDLDADGDGCFDAIEAGLAAPDSTTGHPDNLVNSNTDPDRFETDINGLIINSTTINANGGYFTTHSQLPDLNNNNHPDFLERYELDIVDNIEDLTVNEGENAVFKFTTNQTLMNIQWEESSDGGSTWTTLSNGLIYSGVDDHTLIINNVTIDMNRNLYRAIINSGSDFACTITRQDQGELRVFIPINVPTGFSPNGDGINDTFLIDELKHFPNYKIEIYNRNGNLVYKGNLDTPAWNGVSTSSAFGKDKVPAGVYFYVLDVQEDGYQPIQGYVHLRK